MGNGKTSSTSSIVEDIRKCLRLAILQPLPLPQPLCQASSSISMMTDPRPKRPRTLWLGRDTSTQPETSRASPVPNTNETPKPIPFVKNRDGRTDYNCYEEDPWRVYEPRARIHRKQPITLAQHRTHRHQIVHIRCLSIDRSQVQNLLETIGRLSHSRFPHLRESYYHMGELHLVWEPAEITVNYILTARWPVRETELACILRSVSVTGGDCATERLWTLIKQTLDGIRFLRDQGRVLANLEAETILVDRTGHVRLGNYDPLIVTMNTVN